MGNKIQIGDLANEVMRQLEDYAEVTTDGMKKAVRKTANSVRTQIKETAPNRTGDYADSWAVKNESETSTSASAIVYSRNRYQIAHLLEFGHAKRGGGRVSARPHLAQAEQTGIERLESEIAKVIAHG